MSKFEKRKNFQTPPGVYRFQTPPGINGGSSIHPYWKEPDKVYPVIPEERAKAEKLTTAEEDRRRNAVIGKSLRNEGKRLRYEEEHTPKYQGINVVDGMRIGRNDAIYLPSKFVVPVQKTEGRISRQDPAGRSDVQSGWNDHSRAFEKAHKRTNGGKTAWTVDRPGKADPKKVEEIKRKRQRLKEKEEREALK